MSYQDEALNQLIINKLSKTKYDELVAEGEVSANQLYFIESEGTLDADNGTIENVADPINNTDAANKQYVDSFTTNSLSSYTELMTSNNISSLLNANITYVSSYVSSIPANITYVSSQVSGIPATITGLSSIVSSNYATSSSVTNLSASLSSYATQSDVTYVSSYVSSIPANITYVSSQVSGLPSNITYVSSYVSSIPANITYVSSQVSGLPSNITYVSSYVSSIPANITYVSSQVSGIPSTITNLSATVSSNYALKTNIPTAESLGLSNYAAVSTVTNLSNSLSGYSPKSDVTYVSSQVSGLPSDILDISNSLSGYVSISGDNILGSIYFVDNVGGPNSTTINNTNITFSESNRTGTKESRLNKNSLLIYDRSYPYGIQTGSFSPYITNTLNITNSNIQYQSLTAMSENSSDYTERVYGFPTRSGTLVVNNQLDVYALSSDVSSSITGLSSIVSSNYATSSSVIDLSNSLSGYSPKSDVTYVSSQVSGIPATITYLSSQISSISTPTIDTTDLLNILSAYALSSQVSGIIETFEGDSNTFGNAVSAGATGRWGEYNYPVLKSSIRFIDATCANGGIKADYRNSINLSIDALSTDARCIDYGTGLAPKFNLIFDSCHSLSECNYITKKTNSSKIIIDSKKLLDISRSEILPYTVACGMGGCCGGGSLNPPGYSLDGINLIYSIGSRGGNDGYAINTSNIAFKDINTCDGGLIHTNKTIELFNRYCAEHNSITMKGYPYTDPRLELYTSDCNNPNVPRSRTLYGSDYISYAIGYCDTHLDNPVTKLIFPIGSSGKILTTNNIERLNCSRTTGIVVENSPLYNSNIIKYNCGDNYYKGIISSKLEFNPTVTIDPENIQTSDNSGVSSVFYQYATMNNTGLEFNTSGFYSCNDTVLGSTSASAFLSMRNLQGIRKCDEIASKCYVNQQIGDINAALALI